jgi:hypothetical protein
MTSRIMAGIDAAQCQWIAEDTEGASPPALKGNGRPASSCPRSEQVEVFPNRGIRNYASLNRHGIRRRQAGVR